MTPTAELADVVLPVASAFEREGLKVGFEVSPSAQSHVQWRRRVIEPRGEARPDTDIVFDLACRLGLGDRFWNGDVDAAYRHHLAPSGPTLAALRDNFNLIIGNSAIDPVSGSVPHRAYLCQVRRAD